MSVRGDGGDVVADNRCCGDADDPGDAENAEDKAAGDADGDDGGDAAEETVDGDVVGVADGVLWVKMEGDNRDKDDDRDEDS